MCSLVVWVGVPGTDKKGPAYPKTVLIHHLHRSVLHLLKEVPPPPGPQVLRGVNCSMMAVPTAQFDTQRNSTVLVHGVYAIPGANGSALLRSHFGRG